MNRRLAVVAAALFAFGGALLAVPVYNNERCRASTACLNFYRGAYNDPNNDPGASCCIAAAGSSSYWLRDPTGTIYNCGPEDGWTCDAGWATMQCQAKHCFPTGQSQYCPVLTKLGFAACTDVLSICDKRDYPNS